MKVDILTFSNASNFGAVLQAYALQYYLSSVGYDVKHIDFKYKVKPKKANNATVVEKENIVAKISKRLNDRIRRERFANFRREYLSFSETQCNDTVLENIDSCDAYIVGSDQVWNSDLNGENPSFFLDFVTRGKKISYAGSVGRTLTEKDKAMLMEYCSRLDCISVREKSLHDFLKQECQLDSFVAVDPVFLVSKEQWKNIEKNVNTPEKYIFCYLMEDSLGIRNATNKLAAEHSAKIIWINGGSVKIDGNNPFPGREMKRMGPQQFLSLIDRSTAVVTNSFHGAAFSLIFEKDLCLVEHSKRNERLVQLLGHIGCEDKLVPYHSQKESTMLPVIRESSKKLDVMINSSKSFLKTSINS